MMWDAGLPETPCGPGSMLRHTESVRAWLPGVLARLEVETLLDAPCGDRNWIRHIALPCRYIGVDIEKAFLRIAGADGADVRLMDILTSKLPACDAILSRDFFQHLSVADAELALERMQETGADWLLATCHERDGPDIETGGFRFVDMRTMLGEPVEWIPDGKRKLGVWAL